MAKKKTASSTTKKVSRHGMRAEGKTQTSITLREEILNQARAVAAADGRSFSNWLERLIQETMKKGA